MMIHKRHTTPRHTHIGYEHVGLLLEQARSRDCNAGVPSVDQGARRSGVRIRKLREPNLAVHGRQRRCEGRLPPTYACVHRAPVLLGCAAVRPYSVRMARTSVGGVDRCALRDGLNRRG